MNGPLPVSRKMNKEERVKEIARMLSGASLTSASIANAKRTVESEKLNLFTALWS